MFLKTLTMRGFKSFAHATTLELEPGITCVVGPNGSGKSNVVDALAWVMGEQGAKNLRGGKMDDVIFAGTAKKQGLGRAEVSLTIDNTDGAIPIDYTEVTISRTLFRSGGSEYSVNGAPARLLDIQELLNDSGLGKEMHVIVGQGRLDEILHADPETRRGFIEEAAGVLKHRRRKDKALRKLTGLQTNLDRVGDLRHELSKQLGPLARQAKAATRAATVQAQLRDATARLLADDIVRVQAKLEATHTTEDETIRQELENTVSTLATHIEQFTARVSQHEAHTEQTEKMLARVTKAVSKAKALAERARDRNELLLSVQPSTQTGEDPRALENRATHYLRERDTACEDLEQREQKLQDALEKCQQAEQELATANAELAQQRELIRTHLRERASLESEATVATRALEEAKKELATLQDQQIDTSAEEKALTEARARARQLEHSETDLDSQHETASAATQKARDDLTNVRENLAEARTNLRQIQARIEALTLAATFASHDIGESGIDGVGGPVAESLTITPGHEPHVTAVLGSLATAVAVSTMDTAQQVLTQFDGDVDLVVVEDDAEVVPTPAPDGTSLRGAAGERPVRKFVTSDSTVMNNLLDHALAGVYEAPDSKTAHTWMRKHPACTFVTPHGEVFSQHRIRRAGGEDSARMQAKAELEKAERTQVEATEAVAALEKNEQTAQAEFEKAHAAENEALDALYESDAKIMAAQAEVAKAATALNDVNERISARDSRMQVLKAHIETATQRAHAASEKLNSNTQSVDAEPDTSVVEALTAEHRELNETVMELKVSVRAAGERVKFLTDRAQALTRQAEREREAREKAREEKERRARMAHEAKTLGETATRLADHFSGVEERLTQQLAALKQQRHTHREELDQAYEQRAQAMEKLAQLKEAQHAANLARERHVLQLEELTRRASEEVRLGVDNLIEQFGPHVPVPVEGEDPVPYVRADMQKIAKQAKKEITAIGAVNPLALEEYNALKERHDYLEAQINDIEKSRAELLKLVDEVDAHVRDVFAEAFADTKREFEHIFQRLFPGGEGELTLTDPNDMLTTGVEVFARPAGKRVKRLSLLSGGERSLVAVAILVAIFKARPSPFYVMDEVEAALDDVNLSRLLTVFQELQETSQLIVITHQKRTMEIADALYGVTMSGDGISKVISQKLSRETTSDH